jgi:hypothetical protein
MTIRMDAPTAASLVARLRSSAAAATEAEQAAALAFAELLQRSSASWGIHAALAQYWSARAATGAGIAGHIAQVAAALEAAAIELEHDDATAAEAMR